ncbi:unnamed protein product, partial [Mesorhabditis belari]|uniref:DNA repair and recombination protein RAD54-like n=1 Tax=Mesorhabditis belari TaxID=2138241 RepID=A0AAF3F1R6_9BILA
MELRGLKSFHYSIFPHLYSRSLLTPSEIAALAEGDEFMFGSYEVQIQNPVDEPNAKQASGKPANTTLQPVQPPAAKISGIRSLKRPFSMVSSGESNPTNRHFVSPCGKIEKHDDWVIDEEEGNIGAGYVEGRIAHRLRPHQKEGIAFLYSRLKNECGGAILADEMGLGKSIQTIATCLALLKNKSLKIDKILIVVPSSLVDNWISEFRKWFPYGKFPAEAIRKVSDLRRHLSYLITPFIVCSYDMVLRYARHLFAIGFDVLICDEAHRLKNSNSKIRIMLENMNIQRRVLLTGTPLQNELAELYSLLDFAAPGKFGTPAEFMTLVEQGDCNELLDEIMLRRGANVNSKSLPPKHEYILYCRPSNLQMKLMEALCEDMFADPLTTILHLRTVANHPSLFLQKSLEIESKPKLREIIVEASKAKQAFTQNSGKLMVLGSLMEAFAQAKERVIVFSNFTQTLDMLESFCQNLAYEVLRLDGAVATKDRQKVIKQFNESKYYNTVLLVSTKTGGTGLNLIGASRLVLFDLDWNPANDLQAMARIWREGQMKTCHIYRLLLTGTIDEKILQRQIKKTGLHTIFDPEAQSAECKFRDEDLMEIFELSGDAESNTHRLLECDCGGDGTTIEEREDEDELEEEQEDIDDEEEKENENENEELDGDREDHEPEKDGNEEAHGNGDETTQDGTPKVSMGELNAWRHYSPESPAFPLFLRSAGFDPEIPPESLTFAMHYTSTF